MAIATPKRWRIGRAHDKGVANHLPCRWYTSSSSLLNRTNQPTNPQLTDIATISKEKNQNTKHAERCFFSNWGGAQDCDYWVQNNLFDCVTLMLGFVRVFLWKRGGGRWEVGCNCEDFRKLKTYFTSRHEYNVIYIYIFIHICMYKSLSFAHRFNKLQDA